MFSRIIRSIVLWGRWPLFLGLVLFTLMAGYSLTQLRIDPTMDPLFVKKSADFKYYEEYRKRYGSDQIILIAIETLDLFTESNLELLEELSAAISEFPNVERVLSLGTVMDIVHKRLGVRVFPALGGVFSGRRPFSELREHILSNELYVKNLVSEDGTIGNIIVMVRPSEKEDREQGGRLIKSIEELLEKYETDDINFYIAGAPVEQYEFIKLIRRDQFLFIPLISFLLIFTTYLIYRNFSCVVLAMTVVLTTLIWTMGSIAFLGQEINLITSLLAPVIMIIAIVNSIHFINLYLEIRPTHNSVDEAICLTMEQLGKPCFLAHFTTILGFSSLMLNPVPAIQNFGIFASLGTFYAYVIQMIIVPMLLPFLPYKPARPLSDEGHFFNRVIVGFLERIEFKWKRGIILLTCLVVVLSINGILKLEVDTNIAKQMKKDSNLAKATRFIDDRITGVYSMGFVFRSKNGNSLVEYETLQRIDDFKKAVETLPEVRKVNVITNLIKKVHQTVEDNEDAYEIPLDDNRTKMYLEGMMESTPQDVEQWISKDFKEIRLEARIRAVGTHEGALVEEAIKDMIEKRLSEDLDYQLTGNIVLLGKMAKNLVYYQIRSFGFSFLSILLLIILIFRSIKVGLLAAIPNLIPIITVYGLMGYLHIELSMPTAMISGIVLGLVVDASIHFLHRFKYEFQRRGHYLQALHHTYRNVGQALMTSTIILVVGFATSIFAGFRPTVHFGVLTSLTIFLALICTLVVLPVCLVAIKPFGQQKLFKHRIGK